MLIAFLVFLGLLILTAVLGFTLAYIPVHGKRQTLDESMSWQLDHMDLEWFRQRDCRDFTVTSGDGYVLHGVCLPADEPSDRNVIISHGYTGTRWGALPYVRLYHKHGWNCYFYDLRGHGVNEPAICTYTIREAMDLNAVIRYVRKEIGPEAVLGLHGESLGAATTVACLKYTPAVQFAVPDCGFAEITNVLKVGLKGMHLPGFLVYLASVCARLRYGYSFTQMRPIDALAHNDDVPLLFMHGAADTFIVPENSQRMQEAAQAYSELCLVPGAEHAASVLTEPDLYEERLFSFIDKVI